MTRALFCAATSAFWLAVAGFWIGSVWLPSAQENLATAAERPISLKEIARHTTAADCWMAIRGGVHDFGAYIPEHPTRPNIIIDWCGKEATEAYNTKTKGRPHSPYADELLTKYRIGTLDAAVK